MGKLANKPGSNSNTTCYLQVLGIGNDAPSSQSSALLFFDRMRYIFGAPEGLQRYAVQNHIRLNRTSGVLLTRLTPDGVGGLPGFLLTLADSPAAAASGVVEAPSAGTGRPGLALHGPSGTHALLDAIRTYVNYRDLSLAASESGKAAADGAKGEAPAADGASEGIEDADAMAQLVEALGAPVISNELVDIHAVPIRSVASLSSADASGAKKHRADADTANGAGAGAQVSEEGAAAASWPPPPPPAGSLLTISGTDEAPDACCYVCRLPDVPGKFLPQKAASLGVPRGPSYGKLARGESVVAANGRTVTPEDVMEPATPGPVLVVLDCPDESYLPAVLGSRALRACMHPALRERVACVAHLAPARVLRDRRYRDWVEGFGPDGTHLLPSLAPTARRPVMRGGAALQAKLNALDARFFPLPLSLAVAVEGDPAEAADLDGFRGTAGAADMLRYTVRPLARRGVDASDVAEPVVVAEVVAEAKEAAPEAFALAETARSAAPRDAPPSLASLAPGNAIVRVLGTGSAVPSKYRNVTSTAFDFGPDRGTLLADAGEGSVGQLERALGADATREFFSRLTLVWISHIHADHHVGLPLVLRAAEQAGAPPPLVVGPRPLLRTLRGHLRSTPLRMRWLDSSLLCADPAYLGSVGRPGPAAPGGAAAATASGVDAWAIEDVEGEMPPAGEADPDAPSSPAASPTAGSKRSRPWDGLPAGAAAILASIRSRLGLRLLACVAVQHCSYATGLVLHSSDGWRIVLSGDTRPCRAVALAARGVDLLVHEATFEASMAADAKAKNHSTIGEALSVAARAKPFVTLLTHFSQRYPRVPDFEGVAEGDAKVLDGKLAIAFDQMKIDLTDLPVLHTTLKPVSELLKEDEEVKENGDGDGDGNADEE